MEYSTLFPFFLLTLFLAAHAVAVLYLWSRDYYSHLKLLLVSIWMLALFFSGNLITLSPGIEVNSGMFFLIGYYLIGYVLCKELGVTDYLETLKRQFIVIASLLLITLPLVLLQLYGYVTRSVFDLKNLIDDVFIERMDYIGIIIFSFYFGQLLYANSFRYLARRSFGFEFLIRIPVIMQVQSFIFYFLSLFILAKNLTLTQAIYGVANIVVDGGIIRYLSLLILFIPFYAMYHYKQRSGKLIHAE